MESYVSKVLHTLNQLATWISIFYSFRCSPDSKSWTSERQDGPVDQGMPQASRRGTSGDNMQVIFPCEILDLNLDLNCLPISHNSTNILLQQETIGFFYPLQVCINKYSNPFDMICLRVSHWQYHASLSMSATPTFLNPADDIDSERIVIKMTKCQL